MKKKSISVNRLWWIIAGTIITLITLIPFFVLGSDSIITYHDQLDGELVTYILNAKHLLDRSQFYPEIMNGINKSGMVSPAPLFVVFFKMFSPFIAFMICMITVKLAAFISMFLLLDELTDIKIVSFVLALMFMLLPFYAVYGLCIPGQPLVYYTLLRLKREKLEWPLYLGIIFYGLCSSLALVGYAVLVVMLVGFGYSCIKNIKPWRYAIAVAILGLVYTFENVCLVKQFLGLSDGFVSHKSEVIHTGTLFFSSLVNQLIEGEDYTKAYQVYFLPLVLIAIVGGGIYLAMTAGNKGNLESTYKSLISSLLIILVLANVSAFFCSKFFAGFSNSKEGVLHDFNFGRFSWLLTVFWFVILSYSIKMLLLMADSASHIVISKITCMVLIIISITASTTFAFLDSDLKSNLMKLKNHGDYYMMTFKQFYAEDLFEGVDELIGRDKADYRIVSLGIYPAAAAYNGFYCLDAYSNNYDVNYKREFREVIAPQLDKSEYLADWFDNWGNRCYIVLTENLNYFSMEKKWISSTKDYDLNFSKLKEMGCDYIVSAEYLMDPGEKGLRLLNENDVPIASEDSWYRLFVYAIE